VRAAGAEPVAVPLIRTVARRDPELLAALAELAASAFDLVVVTSGATAEALRELGAVVPATTRLVAIGRGTAAALEAAGYPGATTVDGATGRALAEAVAIEGISILLPQSSIADPALAERLRARGQHVVAVAAYDTVPVEPPADLVAEARAGGLAAILLTSGSVAREVARLAPAASTALVAVGETARAEAERLGLALAATVPPADPDALAAALRP